MNVSAKKSGNIDVVEVEGSIDSKTAPDLQQSVLNIISESNTVVLDITKVSFVSSAGLRVLLMVYRQLKAKDGKVVLVGVSEEIQEVMHMTGFINFFEISPTLNEGLAKF
jgi:anti-sigma B factor antagonist